MQFHTKCFHESEVVFEDNDGSNIFGCECGQFHPGVGLAEGVFGLGAGMRNDSSSIKKMVAREPHL